MGEVMVSSGEVEVTSFREDETRGETEAEVIREENQTKRHELVEWEKFLPKISLRVLLVEADDSTRQIVAALLRKCSYRVAAVADGLKAWEILKGRPRNIDLILTEVDLPLISGYALLSLITEHEICKNIPVIMMSSQDSVSTVYKCMLKGAVDYLVKPLRRNELRNLWQHVWRRQSSLAGTSSQRDESVGQQRIEATSENNSANNQSSGFKDFSNDNKEQNEKGTDAQSSCTKPEMEGEDEGRANFHDFLQWKQTSVLEKEINARRLNDCGNFSQQMPICPGNTQVSTCGATNSVVVNKEVTTAASSKLGNPSCKEAIDFMGGARTSHRTASKDCMTKSDSLAQLCLFLQKPHCNTNTSEEKTVIRHSNVSAFTRYVGRSTQTQHLTLPGLSEQNKEIGNNSSKDLLEIAGYNAPGPPLTSVPQSITSTKDQSGGQPNKPEAEFSWKKQTSCPSLVPVKGIRVNNANMGYGSAISPVLLTQSNPSPTPSPNTVSPQEFSSCLQPFHVSGYESSRCEQFFDRQGYNMDSKFEPTEEQARTLTTEQSSNVYSGALTQLNSMGYCSAAGSNSNANTEHKCDDGLSAVPTSLCSQRSLQREAALTKFRMKRKDRCFEKKVRYESRKKLAEQRPRVKGQFVRQKPDAATTQENHEAP